MVINHLIVGSGDVDASTNFYCELLGFRKTSDDPGAAGGQVLEHDRSELLIIPFPAEKMPNPAHFAFEVDDLDRFNDLLAHAEKMGLSPRSMPPRNSPLGPSEFLRGQNKYRIFYVFDPSGVNLEIMVKIELNHGQGRSALNKIGPMTIHEAASKGYQTAGDSYDKGRPEYPAEAIRFLTEELGIAPGKSLLDLGAGTGKFTQLIVSSGAEILAIEPVEGMRKKFSELLPQIKIIEGSAEKIPRPDHSVDAVVVAQAFHWFDGEKALPELYRVLKTAGKLGLIWNARDESVDWVSKLTDIIDPHEKGAPRYKYGVWKKAFKKTSLFSSLSEKNFKYVQKGSPDMIVDRVASISFISALPPKTKAKVLNEVRELLANHAMTKNRREIELPYRTDVFVCTRQ